MYSSLVVHMTNDLAQIFKTVTWTKLSIFHLKGKNPIFIHNIIESTFKISLPDILYFCTNVFLNNKHCEWSASLLILLSAISFIIRDTACYTTEFPFFTSFQHNCHLGK